MIPGLDLFLSGGQGGLNLSTPATSGAGPSTIGGFNFAPKSSVLPPVAWIAIAGAALLAFVYYASRKR